MAPPPSQLYTLSFLMALLVTISVAATMRILAILPHGKFQPRPLKITRPVATRILVVLGSGGHTHEMLFLLKDLDTRKYTHRTYVVSSGDAFSASRAVEFESVLEEREKKARLKAEEQGNEREGSNEVPSITINERQNQKGNKEKRPACVGPDHYNVALVPRARKIHQSLLTTPLTSLYCLYKTFAPLLSTPPLLPGQAPQNEYEAAAQDLPDMIITNGPATAVVVIFASLVLKFFNVRGANSREKCKTVYVESFARVKTLSLSGKLLLKVVDRFIVQWEELEGRGGRAEFWGILV